MELIIDRGYSHLLLTESPHDLFRAPNLEIEAMLGSTTIFDEPQEVFSAEDNAMVDFVTSPVSKSSSGAFDAHFAYGQLSRRRGYSCPQWPIAPGANDLRYFQELHLSAPYKPPV